MKIIINLIVLISILSITSCARNMKNAEPIYIPNGLSTQAVKIAILGAVNPRSEPLKVTPYQEITNSALRAHFGFRYGGLGRRGRWFVEDVLENSVMVGYENGKYYFRVEYIIKKKQIIQRIAGSRNLYQSENYIHKSVFRWLGQMESNIRQSMGRMSSSNPKPK